MKHLLQLLFPPKCVLCGKILERNTLDLCHNCRVDSPSCPPSGTKLPFIDSWIAIWNYEGFARSSILRFKFRNRRGYAHAYGRLLALKLQQQYPEGFDLLTWVPTGTLRKLHRGYDQVELLAKAVGSELGMPPKKLLKKVRNNRPQSRIPGQAQRRANVLLAYKAISPDLLKDKRILLLDDIITTGATAGECARVLLTAGAKQVHCAAIARTRHTKR